MKNIFTLLWLIMGICVFTMNTRAQAVAPEEFVPDGQYSDLILAVFTGKYKLSSGVFAYEKNGAYYLPVAETAELIGFFATVDEAQQAVSGTTFFANDTYKINLLEKLVHTSSDKVTLTENDFYRDPMAPQDIYVNSDVLAQIWSINFQINPTVLTLTIGSDRKLPFERILDRQKARERLEKRRANPAINLDVDESQLNFVPTPYQLLSAPAFDTQSVVGFDARESTPTYRVALRGGHDVAFASADYSIAFSEVGGNFKQPENLRLRFTRENAYDGALPWGLQSTEWGDINLKTHDFIRNGTNGRGAKFTTEKRGQDREFDTVLVEGFALPGWEVELYNNNALVDFGVVEEDGRYAFEDVLIGFGKNDIKVILYGPQGQIEERDQTIVNKTNKIKQGEHVFSGGFADNQRDLIQIDKRIVNNRPDGLVGNLYGAYGLRDNVTVFGSFTRLQEVELGQQKKNYYLSSGVEAAFTHSKIQAELIKEAGDGHALDFRSISDFMGTKLNTKIGIYNDFSSTTAGDGDGAKKREFEVVARRKFDTPVGALNTELNVNSIRRQNNSRTTNYIARQALNTPLTRFNNQLRVNTFNGNHGSTSGRLDTSNTFGKWLWRNSLSYDIYPEWEATSVNTNVRYRRDSKFSAGFSASHVFDSEVTLASAQITKDFKKFLATIEGRWQSNFGSSIFLRASTSFAPFGYDGGYVMSSERLAQSGPVGVVTYIDKDYDNYYDVDIDEPLPNAKVEVSGRKSEYETDENGYVILPATTRGRLGYARISRRSIDDPYLVSAVDGYGIYPRPGVLQYLELPVIDTGAIDGTLTWQNDDKPVAGLKLELMDQKGNIVEKVQTGADGYFTFERIKPGRYALRADPESGYVIPFEYVEVSADELFQFGNDIELIDLTRLVDNNAATVEEGHQQALMNIQGMLPMIRELKAVIKN